MADSPYISVQTMHHAEILLDYGYCIYLGIDPCVMAIRMEPGIVAVSFFKDSPEPIKNGYFKDDRFRAAYAAAVETGQAVFAEKLPQNIIQRDQEDWQLRKRLGTAHAQGGPI